MTHLICLHHISNDLTVVKTYNMTALTCQTFHFVCGFFFVVKNKRLYSHAKELF